MSCTSEEIVEIIAHTGQECMWVSIELDSLRMETWEMVSKITGAWADSLDPIAMLSLRRLEVDFRSSPDPAGEAGYRLVVLMDPFNSKVWEQGDFVAKRAAVKSWTLSRQ